MSFSVAFWETLGFFFISTAGVLFHFIYGWSKNNIALAIFGSVNESVWEHQKLVFWPAVLFMLLQSFTKGSSNGSFWYAKSLTIVFMPVFIIIIYYTYTSILGKRLLAVDITLFHAAVAIGQVINYRIIGSGYKPVYSTVAALTIILFMAIAFTFFTFYPPRIPLFMDAGSGEYGIKRKRMIFLLEEAAIKGDMGSKAKNLLFLKQNGFDIPVTYICMAKDSTDRIDLRGQLIKIIDTNKRYAIRSSAILEDGTKYSFAGQFMSFLNINDPDEMVTAVFEVIGSLKSKEAACYMAENKIDPDQLKMTVIIQEMVKSIYSGIAFSKNPLTGLSELIVEAVAGDCEKITKQGIVPAQWIKKWGKWIKKPASSDIPEELIGLVMDKTRKIADRFGKPADIEWAFDGTKLYFLQVRPITSIDIPIYSNKISREMIPGIIKPLVWSVNTKINNERWVRILKKLTGEKSITSEKLTGMFYSRAYFNISVFGRIFERMGMPFETLEILMGLEDEGPDKPGFKPGGKSILLIPGILIFAASLLGIGYRLGPVIDKKTRIFRNILKNIDKCDSPDAVFEITKSIDKEMKTIVYYNIMIPVLAMINRKILDKLTSRHGIDPKKVSIAGLNYITKENAPHSHLAGLKNKYFKDQTSPDGIDKEAFDKDIRAFLDKFGHFSDSGNDFTLKTWRETPELVEKMIHNSVDMTRNQPMPLDFKSLDISLFSKALIKYFFKKTCFYATSREKLSSLYTFCYGHYRTCFLKLGSMLEKNKYIDDIDDIFYLYIRELESIIYGSSDLDHKKMIFQRKQEIEKDRASVVPDLIYGVKQPPLANEDECFLKGIPASHGFYTGHARILKSISEQDKIRSGDIIVIPHSDVSWTPLFIKAGAIISESGGLLSHSAIVAREYDIPAVLSVSGAMQLKDDCVLSVNGYTGEILLKAE